MTNPSTEMTRCGWRQRDVDPRCPKTTLGLTRAGSWRAWPWIDPSRVGRWKPRVDHSRWPFIKVNAFPVLWPPYVPKKPRPMTCRSNLSNVRKIFGASVHQLTAMAAMAQEAAKPLDYRVWSGAGSCWADYDYLVTRGEAMMSKATGKSVLQASRNSVFLKPVETFRCDNMSMHIWWSNCWRSSDPASRCR